MASESEDFNFSGPCHLTTIDWGNLDHRRSVAASLVRGVYGLEHDRQKNREGNHALAPPWWNSFHFQLSRKLFDSDFDPSSSSSSSSSSSIYGAIYEFKSSASDHNHSSQNVPKYVVAFRSTMIKPETGLRDLNQNIAFIRSKLHRSSCCNDALEAVKSLVDEVGAANIWLAGHSLGSAIALFAGKKMAMDGCHIETYLFNPPFLSISEAKIKSGKLKLGIHAARSAAKALVTVAVKSREQREEEEDQFVKLSAWVPLLFVNRHDPICSGYIGYFEDRQKMEEIGAAKIERLATQNTIRGVSAFALGKDSETLHLLPSAQLTVNLSESQNPLQAHKIRQWWDPEFEGRSELHKFM